MKPVEKNPRRPRLSEARYKALRRVAGDVDPTGTLDTLMAVAWGTGRRISAILHLRASDVLRDERSVARALAEIGDDPANAKSWPACLRWAPEFDKVGHGDVAPIGDAVVAALDAHLRSHPVIGDGWLFPDARDPSVPMNRARAANLLRRAERAAELENIRGLGWHGFRRAWATQRKAMPLADVQRVGGWRDAASLQKCYQGSDAETALRVAQGGS